MYPVERGDILVFQLVYSVRLQQELLVDVGIQVTNNLSSFLYSNLKTPGVILHMAYHWIIIPNKVITYIYIGSQII